MIFRPVALALLLSAAMAAQNITGTLLGTVTDASGAVLAGVDIEITNTDTNQRSRVSTNEGGLYQAPYLRPGRYAVSVAKAGFKRAVREGITLQVEDRLRVDFRLEVGEQTTSVTVIGDAPLVQSDSASLGQVISSRTIEEIPIRGRNVFDLVGLTAGVQVNPRAIGSTASTGDVTAPLFVLSDISINGGRFRTNDYLVDGVSIMLPENNNFAIAPTPDGTQEFKVLTNSFGPQFGRSGGGVINVVTKGGSNNFHGTVYEFFRNDRLRANNFFSNARNQPRPVFHFNQFGAAGGGRIRRDKTFFFAEYQGHREDIAGGAGILTVPTPAELGGDFSATRNNLNQPVIVYNPFSTRADGTGFIRDPFPGNVVPAARQSRVARNLLRFMPAPNRAGQGPANINNYVWGPKNFVNSNQWSARIDHRFSDRHNLFGRITRNTGDSGANGPFDNVADTTLGLMVNRVWNFVANHTATLSPNRILNLRAGAVSRFEGRVPLSADKVNLTELGFPAAIAGAAQERTFPTIGIGGYTGLGAPGGDRIRRGNYIYTIVGEQTEIHGKHTIVYGVDARLYDQTPFQAGSPTGSYSFGTGQTQGPNPLAATLTAGNGLASLLTGFGGGSISSVPAGAIRNTYFGLFVNDDIKVSRKLTINAGLRWDYEQPRTERYNRLGTFDFNAPFPIRVAALPDLRGTLRFAGQDGQPRGQFNSTKRNFGPRFGAAYRLKEQTALRVGYGIFYSPRFGTTGAQNFGMPGATVTTPWVASLDGVTPLNLLDNPFPDGVLLAPNTPEYKLQLGQGILAMDRGNISNIYNQQWNLTIQHQLPGGVLVETGYAGNKGTHIPISLEWNQIHPRFQALGAALNQQVANPFFGLGGAGILAARTVAQSQLLRPYPQYTSVSTNSPAVAQNAGSSTYHSYLLRVEKRFARGYNFFVTYTNSKLIDNGSGRIFGESAFTPPVQNVYDLRAERSLSEGDISQRFVMSHTVELPFGRGKPLLAVAPDAVQWIAGGWSLTGAYTYNTGFPLALTSTGNSGVGSAVLRPVSTGQSAKLEGRTQERLNRYFDISKFTVPAAFAFGNVARTLPDVRGPARHNYDLALQKSFPVREPVSLAFRAEAFNLTNTPYFFTPGEGLGTATFGVINAATGERQIQFSLKLIF